MVLCMACYYYPSCQNRFAEHWPHETLQMMVGSYDTTCLFHWFVWPCNDCLANPRGLHLSVGHNKLHHEFILLSLLSLHSLNLCKTCSIVGYGHLTVFSQEKNWGMLGVRDFWKDRGEKFKARIWMNDSYVCSECPNQRLWAVGRAGLSSSRLLEPLCCVSIEELRQGEAEWLRDLAVQCRLRACPSARD